MDAGVLEVARPKKKTAKPAPPAIPEKAERETVIHMKGSAAYVAWLDSVHRSTHIPKVQIVRLALKEWAATQGWEDPPEI